MITNNTTIAFESSLLEGVNTFIRYIANEFLGKEWITNSIEGKKRNKRSQCKTREIPISEKRVKS